MNFYKDQVSILDHVFLNQKVCGRITSQDMEVTEWRYQNFDRNQYQDFFSETKSETETDTFFPKPIFFSKTKFSETDTFFRDQIFQNQIQGFCPKTNFS